jgi:hypothetical protein
MAPMFLSMSGCHNSNYEAQPFENEVTEKDSPQLTANLQRLSEGIRAVVIWCCKALTIMRLVDIRLNLSFRNRSISGG